MTKNELSFDELNKVAGGMIKQTTRPFPTGTGPTFPTNPFPFPIPFGPWNKI
ncbi:MAG: hypothetical protein ACREEK_07115 [Bradyrhizobium sp.]